MFVSMVGYIIDRVIRPKGYVVLPKRLALEQYMAATKPLTSGESMSRRAGVLQSLGWVP